MKDGVTGRCSRVLNVESIYLLIQLQNVVIVERGWKLKFTEHEGCGRPRR